MNPETDTIKKWTTQLHKGFLELCVLSVLNTTQEAYGAELVKRFAEHGLAVNEGTLYPLLNRMHANHLLDSHWHTPSEGAQGHPRRLYRLSAQGRALLKVLLQIYDQNHQALETMRNLP